MKIKIIFIGDIDSINLELICKSFKFLNNKVKYILVTDFIFLSNCDEIKKYRIPIREIFDPIKLKDYKKNYLNIYNITKGKTKIDKMIYQLKLCDQICSNTGYDLVTLSINKQIFKKKIPNFIGMTEYLGSLYTKKTIMLMIGENFSIIPITTHIKLLEVASNFERKINNFIEIVNDLNRNTLFLSNYKKIILLCPNPHCGENGLFGKEEIYLKKMFKKLNHKNLVQLAADSAFRFYNKSYLYISLYHDQALIPFKILNKKSVNMTIGLPYRRISPTHGTANDIRYRYLADNRSYLKCMQI